MRWPGVAIGVLVVAFSAPPPLADGPQVHDCGEAQPRSHRCEHSFTLAKVFDRTGVQVFDRIGYAKDLVKALRTATGSPAPVEGGRTLVEEMARVRTDAGERVRASGLGDADFFVVTYEAEWCEPCKAQLKDARRFADSNRKDRIDVVRIEANFMALDAETQKQLVQHRPEAKKPEMER
ncbi:MAG: hypothetical protein HY049_02940 [Acidobacteria bacterium]|nr:hypothetical protein [Acidobacteriota bacterium]